MPSQISCLEKVSNNKKAHYTVYEEGPKMQLLEDTSVYIRNWYILLCYHNTFSSLAATFVLSEVAGIKEIYKKRPLAPGP